MQRIERLLERLNETTNSTHHRVGEMSESTMEMKSMLSTTQERVDKTLKSTCPECSGDLRVYPHRGADDDTELRIGCRDCDHEEYHVTPSFLIEGEETPAVPVRGLGPINADWWASEIEREARTVRSMVFRYDGQEVAAMLLIVVVALILGGLVVADEKILWSLAGVGLSILGLLVGPTAWDLVRQLQDQYHNRYHKAAIDVIDRVGGRNKRHLKEIALRHLENVEDSDAESALGECAQELARSCRLDPLPPEE